MSGIWMAIPNLVWNISLCSPSRISMLTGKDYHWTGVYTDGLASPGYPQDGATYPFSYTSGQQFNQVTTLAVAVNVASPSSIVLAPTAEPVLITAGATLPGGKVNIGGDGVNLSTTSTVAIYTSTTANTTVNVTGGPLTGPGGGGFTSYPIGTAVGFQACFPQQLFMAPGSPAYFDASWDYSHSWPWYLHRSGYQIAWFGKWANGYPWLRGDTYVPKVGGRAILDRYMLFLDDSALGNQIPPSGSGNTAFQSSQPYTGTDHTTHSESNYFANPPSPVTPTPFVFNNQGAVTTTNTGTDAWNTSSYVGTAGYSTRQAGGASAYLHDFYNRAVRLWLNNSDGSGVSVTAPFVLNVPTRGDHRQWVPAMRHWGVTPTTTGSTSPGAVLTSTLPAGGFAPGATTINWTVAQPMPSLASYAADSGNNYYVMIGAETVQVPSSGISGSGSTGVWSNIVRNYLGNDYQQALVQQWNGTNFLYTWPAGTPLIQISSSTSADTGDDANFNNINGATSTFWQGLLTQYNSGAVGSGAVSNTPGSGLGTALSELQCVQARRDRIVKAKTGMSLDELIYDIGQMCAALFANPTVILVVSDNGWEYGSHAQAKGKITPYGLASVGPMYAYWPTSTAYSGTALTVASCTTHGTTSVTVASGGFPNVLTGMEVTGATITSGTTVQAISGNTLTLSKAAGSGTETLSFAYPGYPYFATSSGPVRPNIVLIVTDDDDAESFASGFPILASEVSRTESTCLATNLDIAATIVDIAGAFATLSMEGRALTPIISGAQMGGSPRQYCNFWLRQAQENGYPGFQGTQTTSIRYWQTPAFTIPVTALQPSSPGSPNPTTAAQAAAGTYPFWEEAYDLTGGNTGTVDAGEVNNSITQGTYTAPHPLTAAELTTLRARLAAAESFLPTV